MKLISQTIVLVGLGFYMIGCSQSSGGGNNPDPATNPEATRSSTPAQITGSPIADPNSILPSQLLVNFNGTCGTMWSGGVDPIKPKPPADSGDSLDVQVTLRADHSMTLFAEERETVTTPRSQIQSISRTYFGEGRWERSGDIITLKNPMSETEATVNVGPLKTGGQPFVSLSHHTFADFGFPETFPMHRTDDSNCPSQPL